MVYGGQVSQFEGGKRQVCVAGTCADKDSVGAWVRTYANTDSIETCVGTRADTDSVRTCVGTYTDKIVWEHLQEG